MPAPSRRLLLMSALVALSGTAAAQTAYAPIPPLRQEVVPMAPPGAYIWRPGHWVWDGRAYVWVPGRYVVRVRGYHEWVPGHWAMRYGNWVWIAPHWR